MNHQIVAGALTIVTVLLGFAADAPAQLRIIPHASGFSLPIAFVADPIDSTIQYVVQQTGRIRVIRNGTVLPTDFLDLSTVIAAGGERGLLGMAFPPDHATSGRFFVNFTDPNGHTVVARFRKSTDPLVADVGSRFDLRWGGPTGPPFIQQPFANHNGGHLAFGPDGFLYIGLGDGGSGGDPQHRAQNPQELLGKMLRIDVNVPDEHLSGYEVPMDNPFLDGVPISARPEIWSFGWRNPWRYSFDDPSRGGTGALIAGDVGQGTWEEVDYEPAGRGGRNYGWRNREGAHDHNTSMPPAFGPLIEPIHEYDHTVGQSISGGYVYRGSALGSAYHGRYVFADFIQGRVWSIAITIDGAGEGHASNLVEHTAELGGFSQLGRISSFGVDAAGELYVVSYSRGMVLKMAGPVVPARIMWRNTVTGQNIVWQMNGAVVASAAMAATVADTNWQIKSGADLDGDLKADLMWRHAGSGQNIAWLMDGATVRTSAFLPAIADANWTVPGSGDVNGGAKGDLLWRSGSSGQNVVWLMNGLQIAAATFLPTIADVEWRIHAAGDLNGDGRADVVWRHGVSGQNLVWLMNGATIVTSAFLPTIADTNWEIKGTGDLDRDGHADVIWRNSVTGQNVAWLMNGTSVRVSGFLTADADVNWEIEQISDLDRDGRADLIWRNRMNGQNRVWLMNGFTTLDAVSLPTIADLNWEIQ